MQAAISLALCFILFQGLFASQSGEQLDVAVLTDPPSGPFLIFNPITFTCHVYSTPSQPVTYSWHAVRDAYPSTLSSQKSFLYTPHYSDLHLSWFFCKVSAIGTLIGVGRRLVEIHGFVNNLTPLFQTFHLGSNIELRVKVSTKYFVARGIRTLTWYHNGTEIQSVTNRISVVDNATKIIIHNATQEDVGSYRVEITALAIYGTLSVDVACDSLWLPLFRRHAGLAPVTFTLKLITEPPPSSCDYCTDYSSCIVENLPLQYYLSVHGNENTLLTIIHYTNLTSACSWTLNIITIINSIVSSTLSLNGERLSSDASKYDLSHTAPEFGLKQVINFRYSISDEGFYIMNLYFDSTFDILRTTSSTIGHICWDHDDYAHYLSLERISLTMFPVILTTYKPPSQVNISVTSSATMGFTLVDCKAVGGIPDYHNITLLHSQLAIATNVSSSRLQIYVDNSMFGEFTCIVVSLYSVEMVSVLLTEKASFQLLLVENQHMVCSQQEVNSTMIYEDIKNLFKTVCDCSVDLEHVKINCIMTGNTLVSGTVTYSNSEGNVTASILIDMLQVWLVTSTDPVIMLQELPFQLVTQCPVKLNSVTMDACSNLTVARSAFVPANVIVYSTSSDSAAVTGGSFVGGVAIGILSCIVILCIALCILILKADNCMRISLAEASSETVNDSEEVVMVSDQAYEIVELRCSTGGGESQAIRDLHHRHGESTAEISL